MNTMIVRSAYHAGRFFLQKNGPHILLGLGLGGSVAATVLACRATLSLDEIEEEAEKLRIHLYEGREKYDEKTYPDQNYKKDLLLVEVQKGTQIGLLYLPSAALMLASFAAIIGGHYMLAQRLGAMAAAYRAVDYGFKAYRAAVVKALGAGKDQEFRNASIINGLFLPEKTGENQDDKVLENATFRTTPSQYAFIFNRQSCEWSTDPELNEFFIQSQERTLNNWLEIKGHVFLNEVYDMFDMPRTPEGAVVGWLRNHPTGNDVIMLSRIPNNQLSSNNPPIVLDPNVHGLIFEDI